MLTPRVSLQSSLCTSLLITSCSLIFQPARLYLEDNDGNCNDGVDNDEDGAIDCDDEECSGTSACEPCGNGAIDGVNEECDDGNNINGDGCDGNCTPTGCNNGILTEGENCFESANIVCEASDGIIAADLDGDSIGDIASAQFNSSNVCVFFSDNQTVRFVLGSGVEDIVAADFDEDGDVDLAATIKFDSKIGFLRNEGATNFQTELLDLNMDAFLLEEPFGIAAGDFDGDNDIDLAASDFGAEVNAVYLLRHQDGTFDAPTSFPVQGSNPQRAASGDIDRDGTDDLLITHFGTSNIEIFFAPLIPTPPPAALIPFGTAVHLSTGDINNDGKIEILASIAANVTALSSTLLGDVVVDVPAGAPQSAELFDMDQNGLPDIVTADADNGGATVVFQTVGGFSAVALPNPGSAPREATAGDFNGDGFLDVAVASDAGVLIFLNRP